MLISSNWLSAQIILSGVVKDQNKDIVIGANVVIKELNRGSATNFDGKFSFNNLSAGKYTIIVSYIGFKNIEREIDLKKSTPLIFFLERNSIMTNEVLVVATRANNKTPMSYSNLEKKELEKRNLGQDLPSLMSFMPSVVTTSDAGAGVGYSGIRVRGSDAQRVNVTINGVPLNDSESSGVFWVNMPDFSSSVQDVQLQRGVGTSTNGAASFGASLNVRTNDVSLKPHAQLNTSIGSFNTSKISAQFSTGKFAENWEFNGRFSKINSDGYIDRASSNLSSYFFSGSYTKNNTFIKALMFGGHEKTYQSWNGVTQSNMDNYGRTFNSAGAIYDENWAVIDYYDNEVDNYNQDHYQLHITQKLNENISGTITFHYTKGKGYYEQFKQNATMANYAIDSETIGGEILLSTDLVRRKWLDNDFFGAIANINFDYDNWVLTVGGAANTYEGEHFGEVIWARYASASKIRHKYYDNIGKKNDINIFTKINSSINDNLNLFVDLQGRSINYSMDGTNSPTEEYNMDDSFFFFNPKAGITYNISEKKLIYISYAVANKEPNRTDYESALDNDVPLPQSEKLQNIEIGFKNTSDVLTFNTNYYFMYYTNQLVLTGELNDVGNPIRTNSGKSYRTGLEIEVNYSPTNWFSWRPTASFAINKNIDYKETDDQGVIVNFNDTDISYSPSIVASNMLIFQPTKGLYLNLLSKYVGEQFMTNSEMKESKLDAYFTTDINAVYKVPKFVKTVDFEVSLLLNNILNTEYSSNGYMWGTTPYYYPQAKFNFLVGLNIKI